MPANSTIEPTNAMPSETLNASSRRTAYRRFFGPGRLVARLVLAAALLLLPGAGASLAAQPALVILVRHAERDTAPRRDPVLTPAGTARANDLAAALANARVGSVITTQYQRTRLTAAAIVAALGLTPVVVATGGSVATHVDSVAATVRARPAGEVVLVVGHSNTIPAIVTALGGPKLPDLCDTEYSTLFLLHFGRSGPPHLVRAKYGADAPGGEECARSMR